MTNKTVATASFENNDNGKAKMSYLPFDPNGEGGGFVDLLSTVFAELKPQAQQEAEPQSASLAIPLNYPVAGKTYKLNIELELPFYAKDAPVVAIKELAEYLASYITDVAAYGEGLDEDDIMEAIGLVFSGDELEQRLTEAQRYK